MKLEKNLLKNVKVIITGGSSGIGKTIALGLSELGASIGLIARTQEKLEENVKLIKEKGGIAFYAIADITNYNQTKEAIEKLNKDLGGIDALINNAGVMRRKSFNKYRVEQIDATLDTNLKGVMYGTHIVLPYLIAQKKGAIINTGSTSSLVPAEGMAVYGASKVALSYWSESLSDEVKSLGISVNTLLCGFIDTPMLQYGITEENRKALTPLPPETLIPYFAFYLTDKSKRVIGTLPNVDDMEKVVLPFIRSLPVTQSRKYEDLEPILKEKLSTDIFVNVRKNRKLLSFLLEQTN